MLPALQINAHAGLLSQREEDLAQAQRELSVQLDRAELEAVRADRLRQAAVTKCQSLQKQCCSLQDMALMPINLASPEYKARHWSKHSRRAKIPAFTHVVTQNL